MNCRCDHGTVYEARPDQPWPHGEDGHGAGMPCRNPACRYGQRNIDGQRRQDAITTTRYPHGPRRES